PASGRALRARFADAVKRGGALLEGVGHAPQGAVEHRTGKGLEQSRFEAEIDRKTDVGTAVPCPVEPPFIVKIFERAFDIVDADPLRPLFHDAAGEALLEGVEADAEIG